MAVYERGWRRYQGDTTRLGWRFTVVTRYALAEAFSSRLFTAFYAACFLPSLLALVLVYSSHNLELIGQIGLTPELTSNLALTFFRALFSWQAFPAFFIALIVSPALIAADLSNHALPLYLARPINRRDYVVGKLAVLFVLVSPVTWIAGLGVFALQASLEGGGWWRANWRIGAAFLFGHLAWIVVTALLSLAISGWVRFKPAARGALFGIFFILGGFGKAANLVTGSDLGDLVNLGAALASVVAHIFGTPSPSGLPVAANWATLAGTCLISIWLLDRKLRAHEVVR